MKTQFAGRGLIAIGAMVVTLSIFWSNGDLNLRTSHAAESNNPPADQRILALEMEVNRLKGLLPDQSHAMKDVAYHFANLWFAAQNANWPLADFYWSETRSHLHWAVRIIPVRKDPQGHEIRLEEILGPIEKSSLEAVHKAISEKSPEQFKESYTHMLESCYSCHLAIGKPYLKLQIPRQPEVPIIDFTP